MDYEQALEWVHSLPRLAAHPGVENTRRLLEKLGNPEKSLRFVHVAGTNGKGSATVMLASVLHRAPPGACLRARGYGHFRCAGL